MRNFLFVTLLMLTSPVQAGSSDIPAELMHHTRMQTLAGLPFHPSLEPEQLEVKQPYTYVEGWARPLPETSQVSDIIADESGYYVAGTRLYSEDIDVRFNRDAIAGLLGSPLSNGASEKEVFSTRVERDIAVSIFHFSPEGKTLWVSRLENDLVSSGPMALLPDGRLLLALTPLMLDENEPFSSFIFVLSPEGKVLERREFHDIQINSLLFTHAGEVLAGVLKREVPEGSRGMSFQQYALFLDQDVRVEREVLLAGHPGNGLAYKVLSLAREYDDVFVLAGGDAVFTLDKRGEKRSQAFLRPMLEESADYYIRALHRDRDRNLALLGFYGREQSPLAEMKLDYLQTVTRPTNPVDEISAANMQMHDNPLMRGIYNEMIGDMRSRIRERGTPFTAILSPAETPELINLIDPDVESTQYSYVGADSRNGMFLIERIRDGLREAFYLLNAQGELLLSGEPSETAFCDDQCRLFDETLLSLQPDPMVSGYWLRQGRFVPVTDAPQTSGRIE